MTCFLPNEYKTINRLILAFYFTIFTILYHLAYGQPRSEPTGKLLYGNYALKTSLSNDKVWSLICDRHGVIWVGTDDGFNIAPCDVRFPKHSTQDEAILLYYSQMFLNCAIKTSGNIEDSLGHRTWLLKYFPRAIAKRQ